MADHSGKPLSVTWDRLAQPVYDRLVATALKRRHPQVHHVDGSGGDEGCDVAFPGPEGLRIFELKSWTGRLGPAQRTQVKRSLERARKRNPSDWYCVCPLNLTPGERRWFESLTQDEPFPCEWLGLEWLDGLMAEFPDVVRYFCQSTSDEVLGLLRELHADQAALAGGIPDAIDRLQTLAQRLSELDPFHEFIITLGEGQSTIVAKPKYPGADDDAPKSIKVQLSFPQTAAGREAREKFQRAIDYGEPAEIASDYISDVEFQGIPHREEEAARYEIRLSGGDSGCDYSATLVVLDREDDEGEPPPQVLVALPIRFERTSGGEIRRVLEGKDLSAALQVRLTLDRNEGTSLTLSLRPEGVTPAATRPARRLLSALAEGTSISIRFEEGPPMPPIPMKGDGLQRAVEHLELLDRLQELTARYFPVPAGLTAADYNDIQEAVTILEGGAVEETWNHVVLIGYAGKVEGLLDALAQQGDLVTTSSSFLELGGHELPLGVLAQTFVGARVEDADQVRAKAAHAKTPDDPVEVRLVPSGEPRKVTARLRVDEATE